MKCLFVCIIVVNFLDLSHQRSVSRDYYVAAVVEAAPGSSMETWSAYTNYVKDAAKLGADIIVFPEDYPPSKSSTFVTIPLNGLLKVKPVPALNPDDYDPGLVLMSQAARNNSIYVIVNAHEILDCTKDTEEFCPEEKQYVFNTNLVFDRNGAIIQRYRKNYLFEEPGVTASLEPGIGVFTTDFGVTFGVLTCFDILNPVPWQAAKMNITNIVGNSNWISEMPFVTSIQSHEALAYALDVNLIMSGANNVTDSASGSGIYSGKSGALISFISGQPASRLLLANVPKIPGNPPKNPGAIRQDPKTLQGLKILVDESLPWHNNRLIVPGHQEFRLVYNDVTCRFKIRMRERNGEQKYMYRAGVFSGIPSLATAKRKSGIRDCAVFSCTGKAIDSCGHRFTTYTEEATSIFEELSIEASIPTSNATFYPVSLNVNLLPLEPKDFEYRVEVTRNDDDTVEKNGGVTVYALSLKNQKAELYAFGLWGRQFEWDE